MTPDRRRHHRASCRVDVKLRHHELGIPGTLLDLSEVGAFVSASSSPPLGSEVELHFVHPGTQQEVSRRAEVVRHEDGTPRRGFALSFSQGVQLGEAGETGLEEARHAPDTARQRAAARARAVRGRRGADHIEDTTRRRHRTPHLGVTYEGKGVAPGRGKLHDASRSGLFVATRELPPAHRLLRLRLALDGDDGPSLNLTGKVAWLREQRTGDSARGFGLRILHFHEPNDRRRYAEFVATLTYSNDPER